MSVCHTRAGHTPFLPPDTAGGGRGEAVSQAVLMNQGLGQGAEHFRVCLLLPKIEVKVLSFRGIVRCN